MIQIDTANEKAIVSHVVDHGVVDKECERGEPLSPPPSPETSSTSTSSTTASSVTHNKFPTEDEHEHEHEDLGDHSECNDCSSSVSSQDSNIHSFAASTSTTSDTGILARGPPSATPKRSVFSQYWQKTGQTPLSLKPSPLSPPQEGHPQQPGSEASHTASALRLRPEERLLRNLSNADLLEDDDCDWSSIQEEPASGSAKHDEQEGEDEAHPPTPPPPLRRRRSILPPAPTAHPALKSTGRSWKKSASFSAVEGHPPARLESKTRSLPRMKSAAAILSPGPSCLRPYQKYSPSKPLEPKTTTSSIFPEGSSTDSSSPPTPGRLSRSPSSSSSIVSSVSFSEAVDVRHFEPPRETFSGKGWSDYFN